MQSLLNMYLEKFKKERLIRRRVGSIVLILGLLVGVAVYWQFKMTGVAMTNETFCGKTEHQHDESCYETVLICGLEEGAQETTENESESGGETTGHVHTDTCYEKQLVCTLEEHTHTVECLIDETADVETASDWEATLPSALSDNWGEAVAAVAASQLGYTESTANYTLAEDGETHQGYTRYGTWAGNDYGGWDAMFASFCLHYAGISTENFPESTGAYAWTVKLKDQGLYADAADYTPVLGDLVFFDIDEDGKTDRVGIITSVNEDCEQLTVVEGDYAAGEDVVAAVCANQYALGDSTISGFGTVSAAQKALDTTAAEVTEQETGDTTAAEAVEQNVGDETAAEATAMELTEQTLTAAADDITVTVSGMLPAGASVYAEQVSVELEGLDVHVALDISILLDDGTAYEPEEDALTVTIESSDITSSDSVYYVPEQGEPEKITTSANDGRAVFTAEHFSTYVLGAEPSANAATTISTTYADSNSNEAVLTISSSSDSSMLTGQYASISITLAIHGDIDLNGQAIRVYLTASDSDVQIFGSTSGTETWSVGETRNYTINDTNTTVAVTLCQDSTNVYYLEIDNTAIGAGQTLNFNISVGYANESSDGGTVAVSGAIGTGSTTGNIAYTWTTHTNTYGVTKTKSGNAAFVSNTAEGKIYLTGLAYTLRLIKTSTYSDYGKDPIKEVTWTDTLTLPEGLSWRDGLLAAIQGGNYQVVSASQGKEIIVTIGSDTYTLCTLTHGMSDVYNNVKLTVVGNDIQITWTTSYGSVQYEDNNALTYGTSVAYGDKVIVCKKNDNGTYDTKTYTLSNTVQTDYSFKFSTEIQSPTATATTSVELKEGVLELTIEADSAEFYMGSSNTYTVTAENVEALPYYDLRYIEDVLGSWLYIEPDDMESLFTAYGESLTLTISNATLYAKVSNQVINEKGDTKTVTQQETGVNTSYTGNKVASSGTLDSSDDAASIKATGATITFTKLSTGLLQMTVEYGGNSTNYTIGTEGTYSSVEEALDDIGYYVTSDAVYTLLWDLDDNYIMEGNASLTYIYTATVKDTFMSLTGDRFNDYKQSDSEDWTKDDVEITTADLGTVNAYGTDYVTAGAAPSPLATQAKVNGTIYRDFVLTKDYVISGGSSTASTGDVVSYTVKVKHEGNAAYDALPLVDQLGTGQVLLVPASLNTALAGKGLTEKTVDGTVYYVLDQADTYSKIYINSNVVADTIVVGSDGTTRIYCYLVVSGDQTKSVMYKTLVNEAASGTSGFSLKNQVWLNDHETHRLYAETSVNGSVLTIDKQIVTSRGSTPSDDVTSTSSILSNSGETVTYRLELKNNSTNPLTVTGGNVYDALPLNVSGNLWKESDISIYVDASSAATVSGGAADTWDDSGMWGVTTVVPGSTDAENSTATQCYLVWNDSLTVTFTGSIYIYVTLTYPAGDDWIAYYNAYKSAELVNTFHAYALEAQVSHTISSETKATLFKGVYATGLADGTTKDSTFYSYASTKDNSLNYYTNNSAGEYGYVQYYVVLYNEGPVNLYLQGMTDILPDGFTYITGTVEAATGITVQNTAGDPMTLISDYSISGPASNTSGKVAFSLSGGSLAQDTAGLYYLAPGEAVVFTYKVLTNAYSATSDTETNTITMPFYDYTGGGISVSSEVSGDTVTGSWYDVDSNPKNDGDTEVWDMTDAAGAGLDTSGTITQWLASSVSVYRGEIRPGIKKEATVTSAGESDVITWNVKVKNDGENSMTDYYIYDEIELPYTFYSSATTSASDAGYTLYYTVYDAEGHSTKYWLCNFSSFDDDTWTIYRYSSYSSSTTSLSKNNATAKYGSALTCYARPNQAIGNYTGQNFVFSIEVDKLADGTLVLKLHFALPAPSSSTTASKNRYEEAIKRFSIPSGGEGVLTVSTINSTGSFENGTVTNIAYIEPTQSFSQYHISDGIEVPADSGDDVVGDNHAVKTEAMIPVNYGSNTTSSKSVAELDTNGASIGSATSSGSLSTLQLTSSDSILRYTLSVTNGNTAIYKLILVDNLPEKEDTDPLTGAQRYSDFTVKLAADPNFVVTVTEENGTVTTLQASDYTIMYSDATSFTEADLDGTNDTKWYTDKKDSTRSFRIALNIGSGYTFTSIPANATVSVSFNAVIDGAATGGAAWNSFSYFYAFDGQPGVTATPLPVGVKAPSVPVLEKQVKDVEGNAAALTAAKAYTFLIYEGMALSGVDPSDEQALLEELKNSNIAFTEVTLTVGTGAGTASMSLENLKQYTVTESGGTYNATQGTTDWTWSNNHSYTIVELTQDTDYPFRSWNSTTYTNSYTFTYSNSTVLELICANQVKSYALPEAGGIGTGIFTLLGLILCTVAALLLFRRRNSLKA